jgi:acyl-CoA synthetase (AMP-forming)/AMP-acid ligase II
LASPHGEVMAGISNALDALLPDEGARATMATPGSRWWTGIGQGPVCGILGEYSPEVCAIMLALMETGAVLVSFTPSSGNQVQELADLAKVQQFLRFDTDDGCQLSRLKPPAR